MTLLLKEAVFNKPVFEKCADYELPDDISSWNETIIKQFYSDVNYLPKEMNVDIVVNNVDENKGYAKGSIVVFYGDKKINFPIIVNNFRLSPFDTFVHDDNGTLKYYPATMDNISKIMTSGKLGILKNFYSGAGPAAGIKTPGGVQPKSSIDIWETQADQLYPPFSKMSHWPFLAKKEDLEKLSVQLETQPDVGASFVDNTGDLIGNIIDLKNQDKNIIQDSQKDGLLNLNNVIAAKQVVTVIDSQLIDANNLIPIKPPSVCELRKISYPSMEDFIESGKDMTGRFIATQIGKPVIGVVIDYKDINNNEPSIASYEKDETKMIRNQRNQIFISVDGEYYSIFQDYDKHGIGFYGTKVVESANAVEKAISMISKNTTDNFINTNKENRRDGSDKLFAAMENMEQGRREDSLEFVNECWCTNMLVIFGAGDAWECSGFTGNFRKFKVNNSNVYTSKDNVIIPANIAAVQKVSSVKNPIYKMIVGNIKNIYLIPEGSVIVNCKYMEKIESCNGFINPDRPIQKAFQDAAINKVAVFVSPIDNDNLGYKIQGSAFEPLQKIAHLNGRVLSTTETISSLRIMGMSKEASSEALKVAVNRFSNPDVSDKSVIIYGVRDDYINDNVFSDKEKTARIKMAKKEFAYSLRKDLVKEASALDNPDAVDVVLSLNFINEDSLDGYVKNIEEMKRINSELSKMLIASRMGLSDLDESALKKSIQGLSDVIENLEALKMATTKTA